MTSSLYPGDSSPGKILAYLQRHGEATVKELEELLQMSTTAVREHLTHLQTRHLITMRAVRNGPGRPHMVYFLTDTAQALFPKEYDTLINVLLQEISSREGSDRLQVLLDAVAARLAEQYRGQISSTGLAARLAELRCALEARGIPVKVFDSGEGFQVFSCPYLDVAQQHASVCAMERRMIEHVLGETIALEGTIREGQRSCHFTVVPKV